MIFWMSSKSSQNFDGHSKQMVTYKASGALQFPSDQNGFLILLIKFHQGGQCLD
jgi:hypothetical protein